MQRKIILIAKIISEFSWKLDERGEKSSVKSILCSTVVNYFLVLESDKNIFFFLAAKDVSSK